MTYFYLSLLISVAVKGVNGEKNMGPYEIDMISAQNCEVPCQKWAPHQTLAHVELYEHGARHMVRWNVTISRLVGPIQTRVLIYILQNEVLQKAFDKTMVPCNDIFMKTLMNMANVKYTSDCRIKKGIYSHYRFDINHFYHVITRILPYGTLKISFEWSSPQGVELCLEGFTIYVECATCSLYIKGFVFTGDTIFIAHRFTVAQTPLNKNEPLTWNKKYSKSKALKAYPLGNVFVIDQYLRGPYEIIMISTKNCDVPTSRRAKRPTLGNIETYVEDGRHLVRWNITVPRSHGPMKTRLLVHILRNDTFQKAMDRTFESCASIVLKAILDVAQDMYTSDCHIKKGFYSRDRFDMNQSLHMINHVLPYGTLKLRYEFIAPQGTTLCLEGVAVSRPLNFTSSSKHAK